MTGVMPGRAVRGCCVCDADISDRRGNAKICGSSLCEQEYNRRYQQAYHKEHKEERSEKSRVRYANKEKIKKWRQCLICGTNISDSHGLVKLCGSYLCRKEYLIEYDRTWRNKNREWTRERARIRRNKNPERARELARIRYSKNPERARELACIWRNKNRNWTRERARIQRSRNLELDRKRVRTWRNKNREWTREYDHIRRTKNPEKYAEIDARSRYKGRLAVAALKDLGVSMGVPETISKDYTRYKYKKRLAIAVLKDLGITL
jgi:hypothetical protein